MNNVKYTTESFKKEFMIAPKHAIAVLKGLTSRIREVDNGICYNLTENMYDSDLPPIGYKLIRELSVGWKHHTGNPEYPVPYESGCGLWEGHQLELRIDLINYIIKQLEEITNE